MMNKIASILILAGVFSGSLLYAQQDAPRRDRGERRQPRLSGDSLKKWSSLQAALKKKYPEKYARIETLAQTNLAEAMQQLTALAREAKMEIPPNRTRPDRRIPDGMREKEFAGRSFNRRRAGGMNADNRQRTEAEARIQKAFPAEFAKIVSLREQADTQLRALAGKAGVKLPATAGEMRRKMTEIRKKYPAEFAEIDKLRQTDPRAAMERTAEICQREGIEFNVPGMDRKPGAEAAPEGRRRGNAMMEKLALVRKKYPEEMRRIQALRHENPEQYRAEIRALVERFERESKPGAVK